MLRKTQFFNKNCHISKFEFLRFLLYLGQFLSYICRFILALWNLQSLLCNILLLEKSTMNGMTEIEENMCLLFFNRLYFLNLHKICIKSKQDEHKFTVYKENCSPNKLCFRYFIRTFGHGCKRGCS